MVGGTGTGSGNTNTEVTTSSNDGAMGRGKLSTNDTTTSGTNESDTLAKAKAGVAIASDPRLLTQSESFVREELDAEYSPEVIEAVIANRRLAGIPPEGTKTETEAVNMSGMLTEKAETKEAATTGTTDTDVQEQEQEQEQEAFAEELEKQAEKQTATPVQTIGDTSELTQAELFDDLPTTPRGEVGVVRDTQGPLPNVIPQGQPTLPLQQPEGVGPRGLVTSPPPTGVPTTGQTTGTAGQVIPPGVQVPVTPRVVGAPVQQEVLQAAEVERQTAAQQRIEKIFESNLGKQKIRREYHDTQVDPRMIPDTATALDKEAVADLIEAKDETLDANAKAAKLFLNVFADLSMRYLKSVQ